MKISKQEQYAIKKVIEAGSTYGYGNMIAHLQTAWAKNLMDRYGFNEELARHSSGGEGYPFDMQADLIVNGEWDETGEKYQSTKGKQ